MVIAKNGELRVKTGRAATFVVAASNSEHKDEADYICDGVDDQVEIQAAINALPAGGGKVILNEGVFYLSASLVPVNNLSLVGSGWNAILFVSAGADVRAIVFPDEGLDNVHLSDFKVDGNEANNAAPPANGTVAIVKASNCTVKNLWVINSDGHGIMVTIGGLGSYGDCHDIVVSGCLVEDCLARGIYFDQGVVKSIIEGNLANGNSSAGIALYNECDYNSVVGNVCYNNFGTGIDLSSPDVANGCEGNVIVGNTCKSNFHGIAASMGAKRNVISGNICTASTQYGIAVSNAADIIVKGNVCKNSGRAGIELYSSLDILINGNTCKNNGTTSFSPSDSGINLRDDTVTGCADCVISGNRCYDDQGVKTQTNGITLQSLSDYNLISNNNLRGNKTEGMSLVGSNNKSHNSLSDLFMDVLAASADAVHAAITGTGAEQEITTAITNPDVPRNVSVTSSANSTGDVVITGVDAKGNSVTDTITIVTGGIAYGVVAFASVSKITIPATVANPDTITVGISDKLGLSNIIYETSDVYKVKVNNADDPTIGTVNTTYHTVDCATINAADDITIWYKCNLNVIN